MTSSAGAVLQSTLTCPDCGYRSVERMPTDTCRFFHECANCKVVIRPKAGDCCVFCSYGSEKCPSVQLHGRCNLQAGQVCTS
jgi:hypothetical protein